VVKVVNWPAPVPPGQGAPPPPTNSENRPALDQTGRYEKSQTGGLGSGVKIEVFRKICKHKLCRFSSVS